MNLLYIIVLILILIIIIWCISTSNKFHKYIIKIDEASSGIDIALTKRYDGLTQMIEVVKGYSKYEKETLLEIIKLRQNMTIKEKTEVNHSMNKGFKKINAVVENYPDLKASENYKTLQQSIIDIEEHLQAARRLYNSNVSIYNQSIISFPSSIIAKCKGLKKKDFFETEEKENIKIEL